MTCRCWLLCIWQVFRTRCRNLKCRSWLIPIAPSLKILIFLPKNLIFCGRLDVCGWKYEFEFCEGKYFFCDCCRGILVFWFWSCHWSPAKFGRGLPNLRLLPRYRPLNSQRVFWKEFWFWLKFCQKELLWGCCIWFFRKSFKRIS